MLLSQVKVFFALCLILFCSPRSSPVRFVDRGRSVCTLANSSTSREVACRCSGSRIGLNIWCRCKPSTIGLGVRRSSHDELKMSLSSWYKVNHFSLKGCSEVTFEGGVLDAPRAVAHVEVADAEVLILNPKSFVSDKTFRGVKKLSLTLSRIKNLILSPKSFGGSAFGSLTISHSSVHGPLKTGTFGRMDRMEKLHITDNEIKGMESHALGKDDIETDEFVFSNNQITGEIFKDAFSLSVKDKVIIANNTFDSVASGALKSIKTLSETAEMNFKHVEIAKFETGALQFHPSYLDKITLEHIRILNATCTCKKVPDWVEPLVGLENSELQRKEFILSLVEAVTCESTDVDAVDRTASKWMALKEYQSSPACSRLVGADSICQHPACECGEGLVSCDCRRIQQHKTANISLGYLHSMPLLVSELSIRHCSTVDLKMDEVAGRVAKVDITHVGLLTLGPITRGRRKQARLSPKSKTVFRVAHADLGETIDDDTFCCGPGVFSRIELSNVNTHTMDRKALNRLSGVDEILLDHFVVSREIETEAFYQVEVNRFTIRNSWIAELREDSFSVSILDIFAVENVKVLKTGRHALFNVEASSNRSHVHLSKLWLGPAFDPGALALRPVFAAFGGHLTVAESSVNVTCDCDFHALSSDSDEHESAGLAELMTCRNPSHQEDFILWSDYDMKECLGRAGHHHSMSHKYYSYEPDGSLVVTRVGVYVIAAVLLTLTLAMSLLLLAFWKTRKRVVNVVPILPTGRDDDNWERASFERIVDGEKSLPIFSLEDDVRKRSRSVGSHPNTIDHLFLNESPSMTLINPEPTVVFHRASAAVENSEDDELAEETEIFFAGGGEGRGGDLRTLVIQDRKMARQSLQAF